MKKEPDRRSFLAMTSASAIGAIAGCASLNPESQSAENGNDVDGNGGETSDSTATLTAQVQPDQEEVTALQEDIQKRVDDGELDEDEAQEEFQREQVELTEEAVSSFEEIAASDDAITVEEAESEYAILLVNAPATTFVRALQDGDLAAILPEEYYEQYIQQQEQQQEIQDQMEEQQGNNTSTD